MKLVVFIPALNEGKSISNVIKAIPKKIPGIEKVDVLVVDDGSKDNTVDMALNAGADKIVSHPNNMGIGAAFMTGIRNCISMNADISVIIDADLQFDPNDIPKLIVPILNNQLDVVLGSRWLDHDVKGIPGRNLLGNKICTKLISIVTGQRFTDTQSGFVAYSRNAFSNISVVNDFTFVHEAILDLKFKGFRIGEVGVPVKYFEERKSRVVKNIFNYGYRALSIILKSMVYHRPILTFGLLGILLFGGGILAKIITITKIFGGGISTDLSSGIIILGIVSFMLGLFANVVFKRQAFTEKNLRYYISDSNDEN
ncbi:glycosyltransferase family 2 protein [Nitrosopumilus sp.]|uniref:glycosyltransferase family 2 protein n=1 Tax=Nitrosopumilus sp. TaxID=2024843 RepID=UPI00260B0D0B|nr:glycosyltransferase family 2 protein [Nitrosopumilus sp.]